MERMLYLECSSGIAGDMFVGAMLDLGVSTSELSKVLARLPFKDICTVRVSQKTLNAITACDFDVILDEEHANHDHDMEWLFGHEHDYAHDDEHEHAHDDEHEHAHHHHEHRTLADVITILESAELPARTFVCARRIFEILADAEAKAHGSTRDEVHFHEVGAVDSIVDIVSAAFCLDSLGIDRVYVSPLAEGTGHINTAHGLLPIPVPAVTNIVASSGLLLSQSNRKGELITPTGAAIAAAIRTEEELPSAYRIVKTGIGSGKRSYNPPSMLRAHIIETKDLYDSAGTRFFTSQPAFSSDMWKLETELDDCTAEALAYTLERLYEKGALEAHFLPVTMKKSRPGYQIEVLCKEESIPLLEEVIFEETTTIGIRRTPIERTTLKREILTVQTAFGEVLVKRVELPSGATRCYPEYESVAALAREKQISFQTIFRAAQAASEF